MQAWQFNLIFILGVGLLGSGCATIGPRGDKVKEPTSLRFHLEMNPDGTDKNEPVEVNRSTPFTVNVTREAFLNEYKITDAAIVEDPLGGFAIRVKFNREGSWLLEQYSTSYKGKRAAIYCQFDDTSIWLAAPMFDKRITDGTFMFTPDASQEEAERIIRGLNELGKQVKKDEF